MDRRISASPTMAKASRTTAATICLSRISRPKNMAPAWDFSCRTALFASTRDNCFTKATDVALYLLLYFRPTAVDRRGEHVGLDRLQQVIARLEVGGDRARR